ncbi:DMT family transporter [Marinomonas sp. C2222]|uniref:DMT family transporter n=1 Tax=Marinomonas sargassi TaxID=2984494 RepID=A0ABT2YS75_9GAMM|nr:DMT family transporter [Marinomonas sargassi]MCV2402494.1 DMT family transporter [Marinomonas sargassi]
MTQAKHAFLYGLFFSAITVFFWGMLPIALKVSGNFYDPITLTWFRFAIAGVILGLWQWRRGSLKEFKLLEKKHWGRLIVAGSFLIINYTTFVWSLNYLLPGSAQLSFQVAPLFLALGGIFFLGEKVHWKQWLCFLGIGIGMLTFFHPIFGESGQGSIWLGVLIVQVSAAAWSIYALLQKSLFKHLSPSNILLAIYAYAVIVMLPFSSPSKLSSASVEDIWILIFCSLNTLIAYGAFAQAMRYWQTVQVSAAVVLTPVTSFILTELCVYLNWWPNSIFSSHADSLSLLGMLLVVISAIYVQIMSAKKH